MGTPEQALTLDTIEDYARAALALAIAHYLAHHPEAVERAGTWIDAPAARWRQRSVVEIQAEAARLLDQLEAWRVETETSLPDVWRAGRPEYINTKLTLQSARSGSF